MNYLTNAAGTVIAIEIGDDDYLRMGAIAIAHEIVGAVIRPEFQFENFELDLVRKVELVLLFGGTAQSIPPGATFSRLRIDLRRIPGTYPEQEDATI